MLVLDYPRRAADGNLTIPPFHTGHLGFLPETPVHTYLTHFQRKGAREYSELLITPFQRNVGEMMRLGCIMEDAPGVVERLVDAVSDLNINIVTQESAAINHLNHHLVSMIVDLSSCYLPRAEPRESALRDYGDYRGLVPLDDSRAVALFESIFIRCAHFILWDDVAGTKLPRVKLERIHTQSGVAAEGIAHVERKPNFHIQISVPGNIMGRIRTDLSMTRTDEIPYLILSETEQRVLRVYFFRESIATRIVHLAFYHQDAPRALSGILKPLARAQFNIVTSLLRKETQEESVWEALLEYRGTEQLPPVESLNEWAAEIMKASSDASDVGGLRDSQISIGKPRYPNRQDTRVFLNEKLSSVRSSLTSTEDAQHTVVSQLQLLAQKGMPEDDPRVRLLMTIDRRMSGRPVVFVSYPYRAHVHARVLHDALIPYCTIVNGMMSEGQPILDDVVEKIKAADLFVGIWHHESEVTKDVSPWMPFEYGVALSAGKPAIIVHSALVDEKIWKRINPGMNQPEYSDVTFSSETVPKIVEVVRKRLGVQGGSWYPES